jgi:protein-histidine pros-kinase
VSSAIRDITERKSFEQALQEKNDELADANRAKDQFLATMSHELRTPLNVILGFTGTLLMKLPGPLTIDQEAQLKTVKTNAQHLLSLISDLLDLARIESGKVELSPEPVSCQELLREVSSSLKLQLENKRLALVLDVPDVALVVNTDRRALSQILFNLTSNAIKFTEHGEVKLHVGLVDEPGGKAVEIAVRDTGIGIRDCELPTLFQAFAQAGGERQRHEGTGLGLYVSHRLADLLGGRLTVTSEVGVGSTFTLVLPR